MDCIHVNELQSADCISGETFLFCSSMSKTEARKHAHIVENNGFEPLTPCVQSRCSSQLS